MKQCVQARLQTVPATWNHSVSRERSSTRGGLAGGQGFDVHDSQLPLTQQEAASSVVRS